MKSAHQIASDIVDSWPYSVNVKSSDKAVFTVMIAEALGEQSKQSYEDGWYRRLTRTINEETK